MAHLRLHGFRQHHEGAHHSALLGLVDEAMGEMSARPTTTPIRLDARGGVCIDISGIDDADSELQAAALLACRSDGFRAVESAHAPADAGLEPQRHSLVVMDEPWRMVRAGLPCVERVRIRSVGASGNLSDAAQVSAVVQEGMGHADACEAFRDGEDGGAVRARLVIAPMAPGSVEAAHNR